MLPGLFTPEYVAGLHRAYVRRYRKYFHDRDHSDALRVGVKRYMITVGLRPPFNEPGLYAPPLLLPVIRKILGAECVLAGFGSVVALAGAPDQHVHRDHPDLFGDPSIDPLMPSFAITAIVPLVDLDASNGTTRLWAGTHRMTDEEALSVAAEDPLVPAGSCLLLDYRLRHGGTANLSPQVRPILYNVYSRPWFRDSRNYRKQASLQIGRREHRRVPEEHRSLFAAARPSWWG